LKTVSVYVKILLTRGVIQHLFLFIIEKKGNKMTDTALNNPLVTAVMAVKSGGDIVAVGTDANPMAATIVQGGTNILVGGKSVQKSASFTRPSDTTAYAANDAIADSITAPTLLSFANCANANGGQGYIVKTRLLTNQKTCTARFRLSFYHTAPSPVNDNAPKPMLYVDKDKLIGRIDLDPCNTEDTTSDAAYALSTTLLPYVCAAADTTIYCILTTLDAFTPASAQQFYLEITCELS
jgi:hypothetical protein